MNVVCTECGEPLIGAVNRCWKCGAAVVLPNGMQRTSSADSADSGPRPSRDTISADAEESNIVDAQLVAETAPEKHSATDSEQPPGGTQEIAAASDRPHRHGSPFADWYVPPKKSPAKRPWASRRFWPAGPSRLPRSTLPRPTKAAAIGGAVGSIMLGLFSLVVLNAFRTFPSVALLLSAMGLGFGLWGLYSEHRSWAIAGLMLCLMALSLAGYFCTVDLFIYFYGYHPLESPPPADVDEDAWDELGCLPSFGIVAFAACGWSRIFPLTQDPIDYCRVRWRIPLTWPALLAEVSGNLELSIKE